MKQFIKEFKEFAFKGNIIDLAVAVVMGAAFNAVITSFVNDIISPIMSMLVGTSSLQNILLGPVRIGSFIAVLIDFVIKAFAIFVALKTYNTLSKKKDEIVEEKVAPVNEELETLKAILAAVEKK